MDILNVAILGCGSRGTCFARLMSTTPEKFRFTALCDMNPKQITKLHSLCDLGNTDDFTSVDEFFKVKRADFLIIATHDRDHVPQAVKALKLGYDIFLEKPISDNREELELLVKTQKETGKTVIICHELRYAPGFKKCAELLEEGVIGKLYAIDATERVWYAHWVQAYVRGIGASLERGHPAILAKCSHDLDLVKAYAGSSCDTISSIGGLDFFIPENAPEGSADRCLDCVYKDTCVYSAKKMYIDLWHERGNPEFSWPFNKVTIENPTTEENLIKGLREGEYGVCAYKCKVEKVDHQFVQMNFENGVKASLKMVYCYEAGRKIIFYGNFGEMTFDERTNTIEILVFGKEKQILDVNLLSKEEQGHGGGDAEIVRNLHDMLSGKIPCPTSLAESIETHLMGIAAEESRHKNGELVKVHQ